ncbi:MAG: tetratricopeptide repeat protein [Flavobacteriales bacterium]|nr:tetratricopeptide repeat protein [Flavobacteriales bacterium]
MKRKGLILLLFVFLYGHTLAGVSDSLLLLIDNTKGKQEQAILYCTLAKSLQYTSVDSAISYAKKGFELSEAAEYKLGKAEAAAMLGDLFVIGNQLEEAKTHYSESSQFFEELDKLFDVTQISMILGNISLAQKRYFEALKLYQECLDISLQNEFTTLTPHLHNNLGELYLEIEDYDAASERFNLAKDFFEAQDDQYNVTLCQFNLARIHAVKGNDKEAINGYLDVIRTLSSMQSWSNIASAYNSIAELYMKQNEFKKAQEYLLLALNIIDNNTGRFDGPSSIFSTQIYTNVAKLAFREHDLKKAMDYAKRSLSISYTNQYKERILENAKIISKIFEEYNMPDSALVYYKMVIEFEEAIQKEDNIKQVTQLRMQYEFDAMLRQKELEDLKQEAIHRQRETIYIGILALVIFTVIILLLLYRNQKSKADRAILRKENLELERAQLNQALNYKNKELATNMMYLLEKNEFITTIAKKLSEAKDAFNKSNQDVVQRIINELKQNSSKGIWEEFEMRFKEVHSDFYDNLSSKFPDLTPNEIRICAFLRLNMSTKEISAITHQSVKSIDMARFRLRKKMDIDRDENLISFLAQL